MTYNQKTNEQFIREMKEKHPSITVLSEYKTAIIKVHCKCAIDKYDWYATPNDLLCGKGCPKCAGNVGLNSKEMDIVLKSKWFSVSSLHVGYISQSKKSMFSCGVCGYQWSDTFVCVQRRGCPKCCGLLRDVIKTHAEYLDALKHNGISIIPLEKFISKGKKILHLCKEHNFVWSIKPSEVLAGHGCRECKLIKIGNKKRRNIDDYKNELSISSPDVELIGEYKRGDLNTLHRCKICGFEWSPMPGNLLAGGGCPMCKSSRGEKLISRIFDNLGVEYTTQFRIKECRDKYPLPFDFFVPSVDLLIEYQGEQHYRPHSFTHDTSKETQEYNLTEVKRRDSIKREYCSNNSLRLLEIPYWDFDNIESILLNELQIAS